MWCVFGAFVCWFYAWQPPGVCQVGWNGAVYFAHSHKTSVYVYYIVCQNVVSTRSMVYIGRDTIVFTYTLYGAGLHLPGQIILFYFIHVNNTVNELAAA